MQHAGAESLGASEHLRERIALVDRGARWSPEVPSGPRSTPSVRASSITSQRRRSVPASWEDPARATAARSPGRQRQWLQAVRDLDPSIRACSRPSSGAILRRCAREPAERADPAATGELRTRSPRWPPTSSSERCASTTASTRARGSSTTTTRSGARSTSSRGGSRAARPRSRSASRGSCRSDRWTPCATGRSRATRCGAPG